MNSRSTVLLIYALLIGSFGTTIVGMNGTCIIFGATGDLARRDLIPALYSLYKEHCFANLAVVGVAIDPANAATILNVARDFVKDYDEESWHSFSARVRYVQMDARNAEDYEVLGQTVNDVEREYALPGNRLIYCATTCNLYTPITDHMVKAGIIQRQINDNQVPWHRIVYEKPFGYDLATAEDLNQSILSKLHEDQIVRMDHFLFTPALSNLLALRFEHPLFASFWNKEYIDSVDILLNETLSVSTRGSFYDPLGAMLDVVQNHMLQTFALVAMEKPATITNEAINQAKTTVLRQTFFADGFFGQYRGYREEKNVASDSRTDTFAALKLMVNNDRWNGVPFYFITGKCLDATEICVRIHFKNMLNAPKADTLTIWLAPTPGFELTSSLHNLNFEDEPTSAHLAFTYASQNSYSTQTYKVIFKQAFKDSRALSACFEELAAAWQLTDDIKAQHLPLYFYDKWSKGPEALADIRSKNLP